MTDSDAFDSEQDWLEFTPRMHELLCMGQADAAAAEVLARLDRIERGQHPIALLCRQATPDRVRMTGWNNLEHISGETTAVSFDLSWPGHFGRARVPSSELDPVIETSFFSDGAGGVTFSTADRVAIAALCERYSAPWSGEFDDCLEHFDIAGLAHLNAAVWNIGRRGVEPAPRRADVDAGHLGSIYIAIALYRAVERAVREHGLPRPLALLIGSNEASPHFHAPVIDFAGSRPFVRDPNRDPEPVQRERLRQRDVSEDRSWHDSARERASRSRASNAREQTDLEEGARDLARAVAGIGDALKGFTKDKDAVRILGGAALGAALWMLKKNR